MYATVQINRFTSRIIAWTKEASRVGVLIKRQADLINGVYQQRQELT